METQVLYWNELWLTKSISIYNFNQVKQNAPKTKISIKRQLDGTSEEKFVKIKELKLANQPLVKL
ncbi:MAG: hypothetical protein PHT84_01560 [Candidatus Pacebacteria bacterium]|nr:hypothetical protein [Candidatus Paceibacterota bacterium]